VSEDRKTRRRFLADLLFAGGALTAASVLGYTATHTGAQTAAAGTPTPAALETPAAVETPIAPSTCAPNLDLQPAGAMPAPPPREVMPSGRTANPPRQNIPRPAVPPSLDVQPEGGARPSR